MDNYKIKVNDEAESKEAQDLFFELGCEWRGSKKDISNLYAVYIYADDEILTFGFNEFIFRGSANTELTLPQLRDLVVLHRNDVKDATHSCDGMNGAAININGSWYGYNYFKNEWQLWDEYEDDEYKISDLKPIQKSPEHGLISGADALRALADGKEVQCTITGKNDWTKDIYGIQPYYFLGGGVGQFQFRLKPRTIKLELEIPAPFEPKNGEDFYYLDCTSDNYGGWAKTSWRNVESDAFKNNTVFGAWRTEEEIKQVVAALRGGIKA